MQRIAPLETPAQPKPRIHVGPAALALLGFSAVGAVLFAGAVPCVSARYLHVPCPACGSTRSVWALLHLDFPGVIHTNVFGPVMAALFGAFVLRTIFVTARDGHARAVTDGPFRAIPQAMLVVYGCEVVLWVLRFFGLFGGPCPV